MPYIQNTFLARSVGLSLFERPYDARALPLSLALAMALYLSIFISLPPLSRYLSLSPSPRARTYTHFNPRPWRCRPLPRRRHRNRPLTSVKVPTPFPSSRASRRASRYILPHTIYGGGALVHVIVAWPAGKIHAQIYILPQPNRVGHMPTYTILHKSRTKCTQTYVMRILTPVSLS